MMETGSSASHPAPSDIQQSLQAGVAGIVLCGGQSRRMGRSKADLMFGEETVLQRIVGTMLHAVSPVIVVGGPGSARPLLPEHVHYVRDSESGQGPLAGLATGLQALPRTSVAAYVSGCDTPLLTSRFVTFMKEQLQPGIPVVVTEQDGILQPLAAIYRRNLLQRIQELLDQGERSLQALLRGTEIMQIPRMSLQVVDPQLHSLKGMNTMEEYGELLAILQHQIGK